MDTKITTLFCLCDDFLKIIEHQDDIRTQMTDAEVMTTALWAMIQYKGNFQRAIEALHCPTYIPKMLSLSRFMRRMYRLQKQFLMLSQALHRLFKEDASDNAFIIDSFPVAVCDNIRISSCKIYQQKQYRGYIASKRRYFYGIRVHLMTTLEGLPVEFFFSEGSFSDTTALKHYEFDLPEGSTVYGDKAYVDYAQQDALLLAGIQLKPFSKKNSTRFVGQWEEYLKQHYRKMIETTNSQLVGMMDRKIHAVTAKGFEFKTFLTILAFSVSFIN